MAKCADLQSENSPAWPRRVLLSEEKHDHAKRERDPPLLRQRLP